jgi:malate dehydrogenase (oxaloacetate-decarboxylating)(NADP+)
MSIRRQEALDYHSQGRPGKIQVSPTKPFKNQRDLSLAYTPGVAEPCREIAARPEDAYTYTAKGNLVAVVTNGTAVLGLGNIGPLAGKPVMEGKGILFKAFADIDVFDLEVGSEDPEDMIRFCRLLEPTVGGINLEDIRSPDCFYIEKDAARHPLDTGLSRPPARHGDHHGRGAAQRPGGGEEGHRERPGRVRRRGRLPCRRTARCRPIPPWWSGS